MRTKYIIHLSLINLSRRKVRSAISILLMTIALSIFILTLSLSSSLLSYFNKNLQKNVDCRTLFIDYDNKHYSEADIVDMVSKYKHIVAAAPERDLSQGFTVNELAGRLQLPQVGSNNGELIARGGNRYTVPDVIAGRNFKDGETNVALIPEKFVPDSRIEEIKGIKDQSIIKGEVFLGKKITAIIDNTNDTYTFTVIGTFDSHQNMDNMDTLYIPFHDAGVIYNSQKHYDSGIYPIVAVVDNFKNVQAVMDELYKNGMIPNLKENMRTDLPGYINIAGGLLSAVMLIVALINISLTAINSVKDRTQEIGMLKSIGYNNKIVLALQNFEAIILGIISFVLSVLISTVILLFMAKMITSQNSGSSIKISGNLSAILIALFISVVVPVVACIFASIKVIKIQPSIAMKE